MKKFSLPAKGEGAKSSKTFKIGLASSVMTVFVIVAALLINLIINAVPAKYTELDLSQDKLYSLDDTTKQLLDGLDKDVTIYYICQTGSENSIITNLLDRYAGASSHVRWQQKDPAVYPTFAGQYGAENATAGSSVVVCGDVSRVVDANDYYTYDYNYNYGQFQATGLDAENQFSSAIQYVTSESGAFPKVYQLTGHGETKLYGDLSNAMKLQNMDLESLALLSVSEVPEDADAVILNSPTVDFTQSDIDILRAYLEKGGSLFVTTNARVNAPNLEALLAEYGLVGKGGLVVEGDASRHLKGYSHYLLPTVAKTDATNEFDTSLYVIEPFSRAITLDDSVENVKTTALLTTSSGAYIKASGMNAETTEKQSGDEEGTFTVGAMAEKTVDENTTAKIIWVNSGDMFTAESDAIVNGANGTFALGCLTWMTDAESGVLVGSKSLQSETLVFNGVQIAVIGLTFIVLIPLLLLIAGAVVVIRRRTR